MALLFNNYIAIQVANKQFGLKNNNNLLPVVVVDFAIFVVCSSSTGVRITPVLLESREILRSLWKHYKLKIESYMHFQMFCLMISLLG